MLNKIIEKFFKENFSKLPPSIAVAVSGGCDSLALTLLLNEFCQKNKVKLYAITVNHNMRPASFTEAEQLGKILQKFKINHKIIALKTLPKSNIEAKLRKARYDLIEEFCQKNKIKYLFLGHHLSDVAENFLIRLFRGSGLDGLSSMANKLEYKTITLCRPLLKEKKADLKNYLKVSKIKWFEDESNDDEKFLRNKIRKFLNNFEEKDLIENRIVNAAQIIKESNELLDEVLLEHAKNCLKFDNEKFIINLKNYKKIPHKIALKILSLVLIEISQNPYKPRLEALKNFEKQILNLKKGQKRNFYKSMAVLKNEDILIYLEKKGQELSPNLTILSKILPLIKI